MARLNGYILILIITNVSDIDNKHGTVIYLNLIRAVIRLA